ncbi:CotH kinase family protein [Myxococcota bacterium]
MEEDRTDEIFDDPLLMIDIDIDPGAWDTLRKQTRTRHTEFGFLGCRNTVQPSPYAYFSADVTIDGERVTNVGLRKKGFLGSTSTLKPSLKLKLNEFVPGQRFRTGKRFALNNCKQDSSYVRSCLVYRVFAAAGIPAPRCTFAHVTVNGNDLGIYAAVEEMKKPLLRRHFASDEGNLYEGTVCDFKSPEFYGCFEKKTNKTDPSRADLDPIYNLVKNTSDAQLETKLAEKFDVEELYRFWAVEVLVWHRDGYSGNTNNYFIYADPTDGGRFRFLPWGPDSAFGAWGSVISYSVLAYGAITRRLYKYWETRNAYYDRLLPLLNDVWDADDLLDEVDRIVGVIEPHIKANESAEFWAGIAQIKMFISERESEISAAIAGGYPSWPASERLVPCREYTGPIQGTFSTTWGTRGNDPYLSGTGTLLPNLGAGVVSITQVGARAGTSGGKDQLQIIAMTAAGRKLVVTTELHDSRFFEPFATVGTHDLIKPPVNMYLEEYSGGTRLERYEIGEGTWVFDEVGLSPGAPIVGSFSGELYRILW